MADTPMIADGLYLIDGMMQGTPERLACYLFDTPRRVLIECGPSKTLTSVVDALEQLGIDDLAMVVVTHIHLDHAGGVGHLARRFPDAVIGVHQKGVRHLVDPTRLVASATRAWGQQAMDEWWGEVEPLDEDRIQPLDDGDVIPLGGGRSLEVLYTPGHARHHVAYLEADSGGAFIGDSAGLDYPHGHIVHPNTPPPDFDPQQTTLDLQSLADRRPAFLGFAHFGPEYRVDRALDEADRRIWEWVEFGKSLRGLEAEEAGNRLRTWSLDRYRTEGHPEDAIARCDAGTSWPMQAAGLQRWLDQAGQ